MGSKIFYLILGIIIGFYLNKLNFSTNTAHNKDLSTLQSEVIKEASREAREDCGQGYFTFILQTVTEIGYSSPNINLMVKEIKGCGYNDCNLDIKIMNPYYKEEFQLDRVSYNFISSFSNSDVFYTRDAYGLSRFEAFSTIINSTNQKLDSMAMKVIRNRFNGIF